MLPAGRVNSGAIFASVLQDSVRIEGVSRSGKTQPLAGGEVAFAARAHRRVVRIRGHPAESAEWAA